MSQNAFQLGAKPYNAISEIWSKTLLKNLSLVGVHRHIAVNHSSELSANSDAIHLRIVNDADLVVSEYYKPGANETTQGTSGTITYTDAAVDKITLRLTRSPYMAVRFELYALKQADVPYQAAVINRAKYKISAWLDNIIMQDIIAGAGVTLAAFDASTAGEGEVYDLILQIAAKLKSVGAVPISNASDLFGDRGMNERGYVVVNPDVMRFILREPAFVKVDLGGDKNTMWRSGELRGFLGGLIILEASTLPTNADGTVTIFGGIKSAAHYAYKMIADRMIDDPNKFDVLWSTMFAAGAVVSHPQAIVKCTVRVAAAPVGS